VIFKIFKNVSHFLEHVIQAEGLAKLTVTQNQGEIDQ
jgi:hypothetical protein